MISQVMKQLNDNRSIVVNNVNYFTVHLNLKKNVSHSSNIEATHIGGWSNQYGKNESR